MIQYTVSYKVHLNDDVSVGISVGARSLVVGVDS